MNKIQKITDDPLQRQSIFLDDGTFFTITMYFMPMQHGWFIRELVYQDFKLNGLRITNSPNMLHQFRNKIPFGLACFSKDDREPSLPKDFSSGASSIYVLTEDDVQAYQEYLTGA